MPVLRLVLVLITVNVISACASEDYYRTAVSESACELSANQSCQTANLLHHAEDDYSLGFVEIDDQGQFYNRAQAEALLKRLKHTRQPQYVMIYVHGWHHNAADDDINVSRFKDSLKAIKARHRDYQVLGVYIGWRGETLSLPLLRNLSFWERKAVSEEVGRNALLDFLLRVENAVKGGDARNRLLTLGHSLGASVVFTALNPLFMQRLTQPEDNSPRKGYGDLVVLVNPAFEATRFTALRDAAQRYEREFQFGEQQKPLLIIATSEADAITKNSFANSQVVSTLFETHRSYVPETEDPVEQPDPLSEWDLDTTSVGHLPAFITHRLLSDPAATGQDVSCMSSSGWLHQAVQRRKQQQQQHGELANGEGWDSGSDLRLIDWLDVPKIQSLEHLKNSGVYNPYWVLQIHKNILPNHGFLTQKDFMCFVDLALLGSS